MIDVDQDAYMAAASGPAAIQDFFYSRLVLSEGSRVRCSDPEARQEGWCTLTDVGRFKYLMEKVGLLRRIHGPQALLRQHERQIRQRFAAATMAAAAGAGAQGVAHGAGAQGVAGAAQLQQTTEQRAPAPQEQQRAALAPPP